jgi:transcriptional regulator with XRE-family HTH domain
MNEYLRLRPSSKKERAVDLGEKLRQLRQDRNLTQPELAEAMGIEQSYLSKLENGKSLPSNDVFKRVLDVFNLEVGDFVDDLNQGVRDQLRQIPEVASHFHHQKQQIIGDRRRWLLGSAALLALGVALVYAGADQLLAPGTVYTYTSYGIVQAGESKDVYDLARKQRNAFPGGPSGLGELEDRLDEDFLSTRRFRGERFNLPIPGGSRTYYLTDREQTAAWENKAVTVVGVLLTVLGAMGVVLEKKLSRYQ